MFKKKQPKKKIKRSTFVLNDKSPFNYVEAYKSLRTNLNFATFEGDLKILLVTSSMPDEGKSTVALNLAYSLAQSDKKVLLIDGDLRSPSLQRYLQVRDNKGQGFSSLLSGRSSLGEVTYHHPGLNINLILSGPVPPNAAELYARPQTRQIFEEFKTKYDYVIIDTSPVGIITDAAVMAQYVDGAIMVIRQKFIEKDVVHKALKRLEASGVKILGTVLNNYTATSKSDADYTYSYGYGEDA